MATDIDVTPDGGLIRRLEAQHHHYDRQLQALMQKPYLSADEQLEEVRLKKIKLRLKDEIAALSSSAANLHYA